MAHLGERQIERIAERVEMFIEDEVLALDGDLEDINKVLAMLSNDGLGVTDEDEEDG